MGLQKRPLSIMSPQRAHLVLRSRRQSPMPNGNQNTAASIPKHGDGVVRKRGREKSRKRLTKQPISRLWNMCTLLKTYHLRMIRRQKRRDVPFSHWVNIIIYRRHIHGWHWAWSPKLCRLSRIWVTIALLRPLMLLWLRIGWTSI